MRLKVQSIEIDPDQPFSTDHLNRQEEVDNLTLLIRNINSPAVLAINSSWGTGKTTFIKMWSANLKLKNIYSLYFNAWTTDFSADPLIAFLGEMNNGINELIGGNEKSKAAWSKTKKLGVQIAKRGLPALIKIGTAGIIDTDKVVEDEVAKVLEGLVGDTLKAYEEHKSAIVNFKKSLKNLALESSENTPIVIFIDELDRCRPNYAVNLLERVKHLFDIEGLVFVLAIDRNQLNHSIRAIYGSGLDAEGYLRRFIDIDYTLKKPNLEAYIKNLYESLGIRAFFEERSKKHSEFLYDFENMSKVFLFLSEIFKFSLRDAEQFLTRIKIVCCATRENQFIYPVLLAYLVIMREKNYELYEHYVRKYTNASSAIEHFHSLVETSKRIQSFECAIIEGFLINGKKNYRTLDELSELKKYTEAVKSGNISENEKEYMKRVINVVMHSQNMGFELDLQDLVKRIDMISQFQFPNSD